MFSNIIRRATTATNKSKARYLSTAAESLAARPPIVVHRKIFPSFAFIFSMGAMSGLGIGFAGASAYVIDGHMKSVDKRLKAVAIINEKSAEDIMTSLDNLDNMVPRTINLISELDSQLCSIAARKVDNGRRV